MTTFYVNGSTGNDSNTGLSGSPWKTIRRATQTSGANTVQSGDTVRIAPGLYPEGPITISRSNTTWRPDGDGSSPVILQGTYGPSLFTAKKTLPVPDEVLANRPSHNTPLLGIGYNTTGVTVDGISEGGIVLRHSYGRGFNALGADTTIRYVHVDFCFSTIAQIEGDRTLIEYCTFQRGGMRNFTSDRGGKGMTTKNVNDVVIQYNYFAFNGGETLDIDVGSENTIVRYNEFGPGGHCRIYNIGARYSYIYGNLIWDDLTFLDFGSLPKNKISQAIAIADETARTNGGNYAFSEFIEVFNNMTVGCDTGFIVRGNSDNYKLPLDNWYCGYNTFIAINPDGSALGSQKCIHVDQPLTGEHKGLVEGNLCAVTRGGIIGTAIGMNYGSSTVWRNNVWSEPPQSGCIGTDSYVGTRNGNGPTLPGIENIDFRIPPSGVSITDMTIPKISHWNLMTFAKPLNSSVAVGAGSNGSVAAGVTPPTISVDFFGNARTTPPDIGAIQHGAGSPPVGSLTASFASSASSGTAPMTVDFTDASTSSDTINYWKWTFGDGATSTLQNPTHVYQSPGVYYPKLEVRDSAGRAGIYTHPTGITVSVVAPPPGENALYSMTTFDLPTSTGSVEVTFAGTGGNVPKAVLFLATKATALNTITAESMLSVGIACGTEQYASFGTSQDDAAAANTGKQHSTSYCILTGDYTGAVTGSAAVESYAPDTITLNVTDAFPAGYKCVAIAIAGASVEASLAAVSLAGDGSTVNHALGSTSTIAMLLSRWSAEVAGGGNDISLGASDGTNQVVSMWRDTDNEDPTKVVTYTALGNVGRLLASRYVAASGVGGSTITYSVSGGDISRVAASLVLGISGATVRQFKLPASSSSYSFDTGNEPGLLLLWGGRNSESGQTSYSGPTTDLFYIAAVDQNGTALVSANSQGVVATSNTFSWTGTSFKLYDGDGSTVALDATIALTATGFAVTASTAPSADMIINCISLPRGVDAPPTGKPILAFAVVPPEAAAGDELTFTDLTNTNGATILAKLVDWGDGETTALTGAETTATHTYADAGDYTVTLSVDAGDGETYSKPLPSKIVVTGTTIEWRLNTDRPHPDGISYDSKNMLYEDPRDPSTYGYHSHALHTLGVYLAYGGYDDGIAKARPGLLGIFHDLAANELVFVRPDGDEARISLGTWEDGGGGGGGGSETIAAPVLTAPATDTDGSYTVTWTSVTGAENYVVKEESPTGALSYHETGTTTSLSVTNRTNGRWRYWVAAQKTGSSGGTISSPYSDPDEVAVSDGTGAGYYTGQINSSANDGHEQANGVVNLTELYVQLVATDYYGGLRFAGVDIDPGLITGATLEVYVMSTYWDDPGVVVWGHDTDDSAAFTTATNNISSRAKTGNFVSWSATGIGAGWVSVDVTDIVQEILSRDGWAAGNAMSFLIQVTSGGNFRIRSYDNDPAQGAKLTIVY